MFLLGAVVTHRIFQITSGKKDIEKYGSLVRLGRQTIIDYLFVTHCDACPKHGRYLLK